MYSSLRTLAFSLIALSACGDDESAPAAPSSKIEAHAEPCVPQPAATPTERCSADGSGDLPPCEQWTKIEPEGAVCSDGSQYKVFVDFTSASDNLVVMFEPGGACWDYESCTGAARGAAHLDGIPDNLMDNYQYLNLVRRTPDNPAHDWNFVFVPYCTGDVHSGDKVATYEDPAGGPPLTYRHAGLANTRAVIELLKDRFPDVPQLLVTGCSAGGVGAQYQYALAREGLNVQCGYLLNDSGPQFSGDGPAQRIQQTVQNAWNLDTLIRQLSDKLDVSASALSENAGLVNTALADKYPSDRLSVTAYRMDFNYSLYLYERFYPDATPAEIHEMFWTDMQSLIKQYDSRSNLAYYVPYFRSDNCSHCVSIPPLGHDTLTILQSPWLGSEIASESLDLKSFVERLLDDTKPLQSYVENPRDDADFTPDETAACLAVD